ncbi:MAG: RNA-binding S4 domain-containing protein [Coprobacillus sp.]|nr:RNA-binding S4 domain-containing protein [Coprobacillus sp.]
MKEIIIDTEYITLGKFLKYVNAVDSGAIAKMVILDGHVLVNDEVEMRRGKKLRNGDRISFDGMNYIIKNED